ncbi:MAG: hypothetical protein F9K29_03595 [Hyphomicrobiaceae bacterium]|nr:MAG: hypothetical protein F9K29_03595 [Hyphomicrobiaceae bacterium]
MRSILQWVLSEYPWATTALEWFQWINQLWHEFQSLLVLLGFSLLWWLLRRERVRLSERIETLRQIVTAARDQSEELAQAPIEGALPSASNGPTAVNGARADELGNWQTIRSGWRSIRDRLELLIEGISSARVRGKYSRMPRRRYRDIINRLEQDGELTPKIATELLRIETLFNKVRFRPRSVTVEEVSDFKVAYDLVGKFLPPLPDDSPLSEPQMPPLPTDAEPAAASAPRVA